MNERIQELAVQADLLIKKTNGDEFRYGNFDPKFQKFAELIIRDCAQIARDTNLEDVEGGDNDVLQAAKQQILEYFGVK